MSVENTPDNQLLESEPAKLRERSSFWFCAAPYFEPVLYFIPTIEQVETIESSEPEFHDVKVLDSDGALINEVQVNFVANKLGWLECEPLLASCKFESGLRHGTIEVESPAGYIAKLGLVSNGQPLMFAPIKAMIKNVGEFFPVYYSSERKVYLALINRADKEVTVRCRLVVQQRSPEIEVKLPAASSRVVSVWDSFSEALEVGSKEGLLSYLRCSLKTDGEVSYALLEVQERRGELSFSM